MEPAQSRRIWKLFGWLIRALQLRIKMEALPYFRSWRRRWRATASIADVEPKEIALRRGDHPAAAAVVGGPSINGCRVLICVRQIVLMSSAVGVRRWRASKLRGRRAWFPRRPEHSPVLARDRCRPEERRKTSVWTEGDLALFVLSWVAILKWFTCNRASH